MSKWQFLSPLIMLAAAIYSPDKWLSILLAFLSGGATIEICFYLGKNTGENGGNNEN